MLQAIDSGIIGAAGNEGQANGEGNILLVNFVGNLLDTGNGSSGSPLAIVDPRGCWDRSPPH